MNQRDLYWKSHLEHAAGLHERMAEMHQAAGNGRLAEDSRRVAAERRIAASNMDIGLKPAMDFAKWARNQL